MLGLNAYNFILQSDFSTIKIEGKVDLNQLTEQDWRYIQLALKELGEEA